MQSFHNVYTYTHKLQLAIIIHWLVPILMLAAILSTSCLSTCKGLCLQQAFFTHSFLSQDWPVSTMPNRAQIQKPLTGQNLFLCSATQNQA